jgi:hypothetical protein
MEGVYIIISLFLLPSLFHRISLISPTCRIDSEFTAALNGLAGTYLVYALLTCNPDRGKVEEEAQSNEEQEE